MHEIPQEGLSSFFDFVWGSETEGFVYLPTKDRDDSWHKVMFPWPVGKNAVINHVLESTAASKDVYFSPALFDKARPIKENALGSYILWADFDGSAPQEWTPESHDTGSEPSGPPAVPVPSLRIQSSTEDHQHVYWHLDEFCTDINFIEEKNRAIAYTLGADTSGWDVNQVLRPPHTTNYKHDIPVIVAEEREEVYSRTRFDFLKAAKQLVSETLSIDSTVPVEDILANYPWDKDTYALFTAPTQPDGYRSTALMQIGYFGAEQGMKDEEIFSLLVDADNRWGKFVKRSDRVKRLSDIVNRARQKHPVATTSDTFAGLLGTATTDKIEVDVRYVYGFEDFLNSEFKVDWKVDQLIAQTGIGLITSAPGVGKTQISIQFGIHMALGKEFLRWKPLGRSKVGYLSLEMGKASSKLFIDTISKSYSPEEIQILQRNFQIAPLGESIPLDRPEGKKFLESLIEQHKWDMVIIDSLGKLTGGELSDDTTMRRFFDYLAKVRNKFDCAFLIIHHNRKGTSDNKKPRNLEDVFGSQYITSETDFVLSLWRENGRGNTIEVRELKNRLAPQREPFEIERIEHLAFSYEGDIELSGDAPILRGGIKNNGTDDPDSDIFTL